jgi:hypothetical protein
MSPMSQFDQESEKIIRELTLRIAAPRWSQFHCAWETANKVYDRCEITKAS